MDWPTIQILSLGELRALPRFEGGPAGEASGVYFIWYRDDSLGYVGSSNRFNGRLPSHKREFYFSYATVLVVPSPWHAAVEIAYIQHYKPRFNSNHNPGAKRGHKSKDGWGKVARKARAERHFREDTQQAPK